MPKAAAKPKTQYVCEQCGASFPRWSGQCDSCGGWNTLSETVTSSRSSQSQQLVYGTSEQKVLTATDALQTRDAQTKRMTTGFYELDRVFGGGIVKGSVFLVGGEPGIGKSTIITQTVINILTNNDKLSCLYVAGEESPHQISQRIQRMIPATDNQDSHWSDRLSFFTGVDVDELVAWIRQHKPGILVVDSVQTMITQELSGMAGSIGQLREATSRIVAVAKQNNIPTFLIGHVTKEGDIAGPKVLEHIVDSVVQISGDRHDAVRIVRSLKNRFGPTDEVGLFRLTDKGAEEVQNPAEIFLSGDTPGQPGSALAVCMEGSRPVVVEVQALVVNSSLPSPRRVARGIPTPKLHLLLAVLQKHAKLNLSFDDVYVNVVGSMSFQDPGIDLALAAALISSKKGISPGKNTVYCGEIGLLGEVRQVIGQEKRAKEAKRLGYQQVVSPASTKSVSRLFS